MLNIFHNSLCKIGISRIVLFITLNVIHNSTSKKKTGFTVLLVTKDVTIVYLESD